MDCGPAALKSFVEGLGRPVSYGRLREACQTGLDGTSIDTLEQVANQLGVEAEQVMLPADHLIVGSGSMPAIVVVTLAGGITHFVVLWRKVGPMLQIMDPSVGRRWITIAQFAREVYTHALTVPASDWFDFAQGDEFQSALQKRMRALGISRPSNNLSWRELAALDGAVRMCAALVRERGLRPGQDADQLFDRLRTQPDLIPNRYWSALPHPHGEEEIMMRGAVLVRAKGLRPATDSNISELGAALVEKPLHPGRELCKTLRQSGTSFAPLLAAAMLIGAGGVIVEALLFRGLFDIAGNLGIAGQRMAAMFALLLFSSGLLFLELPVMNGFLRFGRQIETRFRIAFLEKIPKLGDRYFRSRLTSDMAERSHATHRLRHLPVLIRNLLQGVFEMLATAAGIVWLEPRSLWIVLAVTIAALLPAFLSQPVLAERELRTRSHAAGLMRFYLDAMLGLIAIRAHGAERSLRREHEKLLGEWAFSALRLQHAVILLQAVQVVAMFGLVAWLLVSHPPEGANIGRVLLVAYWALNLPSLGNDIGELARQYPYYRNLTLRLLEPLSALEERSAIGDQVADTLTAPAISFQKVSTEAGGHQILGDVDLEIAAGEHLAIVGPSGAGKSSIVSLLLGWLKPTTGAILVNSSPLDCETLRSKTAWVDPSIQIWNRTVLSNIAYGEPSGANSISAAIDGAMLRSILESLPEGMQTKLGEGGGLISGGEGQRVRLARALLRQEAPLVILDEPFRGLDREKRQALLARARAHWKKSTLICITHDISETCAFDRVAVIEQGGVVETGDPRELLRDGESRFRQLLDAEEATRTELWSGDFWRRIRVHSGRLVEELPVPAKGDKWSEVA